jgi:MFS transporter, PAT family, beta-lactamase induction signal transducer AmpG
MHHSLRAILAKRTRAGTIVTLQETSNRGLTVFRSKRMAVLFLFGFSGGLPLLLTGQTLQAWMTAVGLDLGSIAELSAVGLAYTFKFVWAPVLDYVRLPFLGRRRGWLLVFQLGLVVAIAVMGAIDPLAQPLQLAAVAVVVAFLSSLQDIVIDAYNADSLAPHERAAGAAAYVIGYRTALVLTGTLALILADHLPWRTIYAGLAALMVIGVIATLIADEPAEVARPRRDASLIASFASALVLPFQEFWKRLGLRGLLLVTGFAALYRFGDYFAQALIITFFKRGVGFSFTEIGVVNKGVGFLGIALGGLFAGSLVARFGLRKMLVAFGVLSAITNLLYSWLALAGHDFTVFCIAVFVDNVSYALGITAFLSVLMGACSPAVSATQMALLTSLSSVGQRVFGWLAADVVDAVSWSGFFAVTAALAIPGLVLAWWVARTRPDV